MIKKRVGGDAIKKDYSVQKYFCSFVDTYVHSICAQSDLDKSEALDTLQAHMRRRPMTYPHNTREGFLAVLSRLRKGQTLHILMRDERTCVSIRFEHVQSTGKFHVHGRDMRGNPVGILIENIQETIIIDTPKRGES